MGGPNTKRFRLPVNTGVRCDTFPEDVPLMDTNNFVLSPDGSELCPREGYEIRRNDSIGYNSGRKNIYFVSNPPDINYGDLIVVVNTKNNRRFNEVTEVVRTTQTASTIDPDGNLQPMPDNPDETIPYADYRPLRYQQIRVGGDATDNYTVLMQHYDDYTIRSETFDFSDISGAVNIPEFSLVTKNLFAVLSYNVDAVAVFDMVDVGENPGDTHTPANTWTFPVDEAVINFWVDSANDMAVLTSNATEYLLYVGGALDSLPTPVSLGATPWGANLSFAGFNVLSDLGESGRKCSIAADGSLLMALRFNDGTVTYNYGCVKADGTAAKLDTGFPDVESYNYRNVIAQKDVDELYFFQGHGGTEGSDVAEMYGCEGSNGARTLATGITINYHQNAYNMVMAPNGTTLYMWGLGGDDMQIATIGSGFALTSVADVDNTAIWSGQTQTAGWIDTNRIGVTREVDQGSTYDIKLYILSATDGSTLDEVDVLMGADWFGVGGWCYVPDPYGVECIYNNALISAGA